MLYCNDFYCDIGTGELKNKKKIDNFRRVGSVRPSSPHRRERTKIRVKIGKEKREETTIDKTKNKKKTMMRLRCCILSSFFAPMDQRKEALHFPPVPFDDEATAVASPLAAALADLIFLVKVVSGMPKRCEASAVFIRPLWTADMASLNCRPVYVLYWIPVCDSRRRCLRRDLLLSSSSSSSPSSSVLRWDSTRSITKLQLKVKHLNKENRL